MIFEFDGQTWDTDRPVFVVGRNSRIWAKVTWYLYSKKRCVEENRRAYREDGIACKKMWIKTVFFEEKEGVNAMKEIEFTLPNGRAESTRLSDSFASHKRETAVTEFLNSLEKQENNHVQTS